MAVADDLFQLIHSLTPSEKRYFKIHAKTHVGDKYKNSYEKLFDAINYWPADEEYDEKLFKRKHKGKTFLKNLSVEKNYLYELILETMRSFHDKKTIDRQINDLLLDEDFFRKKRLNEQRKKAIEKGKELAKKYEKMPALLILLSREKDMQIEWQPKDLKDLTGSVDNEELKVTEHLHNLAKLSNYSNLLFVLVRINTTLSNTELKEKSTEIINEHVVKHYVPGTSFHEDRHYYRIHAMHYRIHQNFSEHKNYSRLLFELYDIHYPNQKQISPSAYKISIYNYLNSCFTAGDMQKFPELLQKARSIGAADTNEEGEDWQNLIHLELLYLSNTGQLDKATKLTSDIEQGLIKHKSKVNKARELAIYYNLAAVYFIKGEWLNAATYYNKILLDKSDARTDLKGNAELIILAIQLELKNEDGLLYMLKNIERRFKTQKTHEKYASFLKYIGSLLQNEKRNDNETISELNKQFFRHSELIYWINSKHQKKSMLELFLKDCLKGPV